MFKRSKAKRSIVKWLKVLNAKKVKGPRVQENKKQEFKRSRD